MPVNKSSVPFISVFLSLSGCLWCCWLLNVGVFPPLSLFPVEVLLAECLWTVSSVSGYWCQSREIRERVLTAYIMDRGHEITSHILLTDTRFTPSWSLRLSWLCWGILILRLITTPWIKWARQLFLANSLLTCSGWSLRFCKRVLVVLGSC